MKMQNNSSIEEKVFNLAALNPRWQFLLELYDIVEEEKFMELMYVLGGQTVRFPPRTLLTKTFNMKF